jgi:hypothetical protein
MAHFQTKNPDLGTFWRILQWKMLVYYTAIGSISRLLGIVCGLLAYFMVIWYFYRFGMLHQTLATLLEPPFMLNQHFQ